MRAVHDLLVPNFNAKVIKPFSFASNEDKQLHGFVAEDVKEMDKYSKPAREQGREAIQGYMAIALDALRNDTRSRLFPPALHGIIYSSLAQQASQVPKVEYKHRKADSEPKMKFLNAALKHSEAGDYNLRPPGYHLWFTQNFDKELFGLGARYQSYLLQTREVHIKDDNGNWKTKTMIVYDDIWDENVDFFHFGVSRDMLPGMFQGRACYFDKFYSRDAFMERFNTPFYENLDRVPDDWYQGESDANWEVPKDFVRVRHYYDLYKDLMYVLANGVPIRKDYILDYGDPSRPKKFLPISTIHNDIGFETQEGGIPSVIQQGRIYADISKSSTNKTFWTMGNATLVKGLIALKRALWRAAADNIKASSVHFLLARSAGVFDQIRTADLYGIVPIKDSNPDAFDVKSLTQGSDFLQKWMQMDENIESMIAGILGNDWRRTATEMTNEKATVAAIRQQVQRMRANQNAKFNESGPIPRHYMIRLNLIQQYYPEPTEIPVENGKLPDGLDESEVIRDADGRPVKYKKLKEIPFDKPVVEIKGKDGNFRPLSPDHPDAPPGASSENLIKARAQYLRTEEEPEIYVEAGSSFAELKALERALFNDTLASIQPFFGLVYPDDKGQPAPVIPKEGVKYILEKFAEISEWDKEKLLGKEPSPQDEIIPPPPGVIPDGAPPPGAQMPSQVLPPQPMGNPMMSPMNAAGARMKTL